MIHRLLLAALLTASFGCTAEAPPLDAQPEAPSTPEPKTAPKAPPVAEAPAEPVVDTPADPVALAPGPESDAPPVASDKPKDKQPIVAPAPKPAPKAKPEPAPAPKSTAETANAKPPKVPDSSSAKPVTPAPARPFDEAYATLLAEHVKNGRVDYSGLRASRKNLDTYAERLASLPGTTYSSWSSRRKLVFWINAYNALTLKLIVDKASGKTSIRQIDKPWDKPKFSVMGQRRSLNDIEHKIIRKQWSEPRVHMALVCGAKGCPILMSQPYSEAGLYTELARVSRRYLASPAGAVVDETAGTLRISKIFDWYGDDWITGGLSKDAAVRAFIVKYGPTSAKGAANYPLSYLNYDWSLNGR